MIIISFSMCNYFVSQLFSKDILFFSRKSMVIHNDWLVGLIRQYKEQECPDIRADSSRKHIIRRNQSKRKSVSLDLEIINQDLSYLSCSNWQTNVFKNICTLPHFCLTIRKDFPKVASFFCLHQLIFFIKFFHEIKIIINALKSII